MAAETQSLDALGDRRSLKRKLARAELRNKLRALALVAPLLLFILVSFVLPIGDMLTRAVENDIVPDTLPRTVAALENWDPTTEDLPPEAAFAAMIDDLREAAENKLHTRLGTRLNYDSPGASSLLRKTPRKIAPRGAAALKKVDARIQADGAKAVLIDADADWGDPKIWRAVKLLSGRYTSGYFVAAADAKLTPDGVEMKPEDRRIYIDLFQRTLIMSVLITLMTLLLGYPIAYLLATLPMRISNLLLILVLLPFWTSLLVRTSAWIVLLQQQGVVNDLMVFTGVNTPIYYMLSSLSGMISGILSIFGASDAVSFPDVTSLCRNNLEQIIGSNGAVLTQFLERQAELTLASCTRDVLATFEANGLGPALAQAQSLYNAGIASSFGDERFAMIFNQTGTVIAMTHILLPFMILPLYSVMKTIPPSYVRAAKSLGASNVTAFMRVYFPNTVPGIGAGAVLVFILAIGYYITPELVGGTEGTFISNRIAYHISYSLNWGLAAALGSMLLAAVLILYFVYDRIVGIDNVKLG